jgi:pimeloyl-ACP methyl ester carboxylesterase
LFGAYTSGRRLSKNPERFMPEIIQQLDPNLPLLGDPGALDAAHKEVVMIPGALVRLEMFSATRAWSHTGVARVYLPFPGLDGRPLAPKLEIEDAAMQIAAFAAQRPGKAYRLLGYSTGGPIAIRAAEQMQGDVRVAALASAVERAGGLESMQRIARDVLAAAVRVRSVRRRVVWREYFKVLLFGPAVLRDKALAARAEELMAGHLPRMVYPDRDLLAAHSDDLRRWRLPPRRRLQPDRLAFFAGAADPVFSLAQTEAFAQAFGAAPVTSYPGHGHLPFMTHPKVFEDIRAYLDLDRA